MKDKLSRKRKKEIKKKKEKKSESSCCKCVSNAHQTQKKKVENRKANEKHKDKYVHLYK